MQQCGPWPIGVCSWSLQTSLEAVIQSLQTWNINHVHLGLAPLLADQADDAVRAVESAPWQISATMIDFPQEDYSTLEQIRVTGGVVPDAYWQENLKRFEQAVIWTDRLGVSQLSMHLGFIDMEDSVYLKKMQERTRQLAEIAQERNVALLLETGQETAQELKTFLESLACPNLAINFDPANMILYDKGDPLEAIGVLAPWVKHVHIKDANRTTTPGTWGEEVPWGQGQVQTGAFLDALKGIGFQGTLAIEREAGTDRPGDIQSAIEKLLAHR